MPLGSTPRLELSLNRRRWSVRAIHRYMQKVAKIGLSGQDLHFIRVLMGRVLNGVPSKDPRAALEAIFHFWHDGHGGALAGQILAPNPSIFRWQGRKLTEIRIPAAPWHGLRYEWDPRGVHQDHSLAPIDLYSTPARSVEAGIGDCFPEGTLLLRDDYTFVPIEHVQVGERIWGYDRWTKVTRRWSRGQRKISTARLNNGADLALTPEHKLWVAECGRHGRLATPCSCPVDGRDFVRVPLCEVAPGAVLLRPKSIPWGSAAQDPDLAWLDGVYLADGWGETTHINRINISGLDGAPKEAQKVRVKEICERYGVPYRWARKYISVKSREWAERMHPMGGRAPEKKALDLNLREESARELLSGILSDSGRNSRGGGRTFTTTSRMLYLQTRMLLKMQGLSCGQRYVVEHGGLGNHPIYRLQIPAASRDDGKPYKLLRVREVAVSPLEVPTYDIATEDRFVYLPEHDVTVSNCDDHTLANVVSAKAIGFRAGAAYMELKVPRPVPGGPSRTYHVVGVVCPSRTQDVPIQNWLWMDTTEQEAHLGWRLPSSMISQIEYWEI